MTRALFMGASKKKPTVIVAGGVDGYIVRSEDGINWSTVYTGGDDIYEIIFAGGLFVASTSDGVYVSSDGTSWTPRAVSDLQCIAYGGGLFATAGNAFYTSSDGVTWTSRSLSVLTGTSGPDSVSAIAHNGGSNWVLIGVTGTTSRPYTKTGSPASGAWTSQTALTGADLYRRLRYANGAFYMMRQTAGGQLYRSTDSGASFAQGAIVGASNCSADWDYSGSLWMAVGTNGSTPQMKTSTDLSSWTTVTTTFFTSTAIAAARWVPGLGLWVIGGSGGLMAYSPDASSWTLGSVSGLGTRAIQAIAYGNI